MGRIKIYAYYGKILRIDNSKEMFIVRKIGVNFFKKYLGGVDVASKIILNEVARE